MFSKLNLTLRFEVKIYGHGVFQVTTPPEICLFFLCFMLLLMKMDSAIKSYIFKLSLFYKKKKRYNDAGISRANLRISQKSKLIGIRTFWKIHRDIFFRIYSFTKICNKKIVLQKSVSLFRQLSFIFFFISLSHDRCTESGTVCFKKTMHHYWLWSKLKMHYFILFKRGKYDTSRKPDQVGTSTWQFMFERVTHQESPTRTQHKWIEITFFV